MRTLDVYRLQKQLTQNLLGVAGALVVVLWMSLGPIPANAEAPKPPIKEPIVEPGRLPDSCQPARVRASELLVELDRKVSPEARAEAARYVAGRDRAVTEAKAWNDFAIAAQLMGHRELAAWVGLKAIKVEWDGDYLTNTAVFLTQLDKHTEALRLLNCAYAMDYRSPYLFEALATVSQRLGETSQAKQYILQAKELAPNDQVIQVQAALLTTGQPPPAPKAERRDSLEEAIAELQAHGDEAAGRIQRHFDSMKQIGVDIGKDETTAAARAQVHARNLEGVRALARETRLTRKEVETQLAPHGFPPLSEEQYRKYIASRYNLALINAIIYYLGVTHDILLYTGGYTTEMFFWADVLHMNPARLAEEQRKKPFGGSQPLAINLVVDWGSGGDLAHSSYADLYHYLMVTVPEIAHRQTCPCVDCARARALYERYSTEAEYRYNLAARRFDRVAQATLAWAESELLDARDYAVRYVNALKPPESAEPYMRYQESMNQINFYYRTLVDFTLNPAHRPGVGVAAVLRERAERFVRSRAGVERDIAHWGEVTMRECLFAIQKKLDKLSQAEWEAYRAALIEQMKGDVQAKFDPTPHCEASIGDLSVTLDTTGKLTGSWKWKWQGGDLKAKLDATNAAVTIGPSASVSDASGVAGKIELTLYEKWDTASGRRDTVAEFSGKLGVGFKKDKVGGVACYPGTANVKFHARSFAEHAWEYTKTEGRRTR